MKHILWIEFGKAFSELKGAFSRQSTFLWAVIFCAGIAIRTDLRGVSSIVDCLGLRSAAYYSLLRVCHSSAVDLDRLRQLWILLCLKIFSPVCIEGHMVLFGDGIKIPKEGKKMPAVKLMHQDSQSNSKPEYIMGHFLQSISLAVVTPLGKIAAIPIVARIHDGLVYSNRSKETVIDRFANLVAKLCVDTGHPAIIVADAYYAARSMIAGASQSGCILVSRVQRNVVAFLPAPPSNGPRGRGRPRTKGEKIRLRDLFKKFDEIGTDFLSGRYCCIDLYWPSAGGVVRFVLCDYKGKGRAIFMSTDLSLSPVTIINLYANRWLIETGFKQAVSVIGSFAYHFWMKHMTPIRRGQTKQYLHRESKSYREQIARKLHAFHVFIAFGCITQGLLLHLSINFRDQVWASFSGWLRTIRKSVEPSELVVSNALRSTLPIFLGGGERGYAWVKFMQDRIDPGREGPLSRTG